MRSLTIFFAYLVQNTTDVEFLFFPVLLGAISGALAGYRWLVRDYFWLLLESR